MSKKEYLFYKVPVDPLTEYEIKVRIGDGQPGDHNVFGLCPFETKPKDNEPEWISKLGSGDRIKGEILYISSVTQDTNPNTNFVSVRLFINGTQIKPYKGESILEVEQLDIVYFNQQVDFI